MTLQPGTLIGGRYELTAPIAVGGMGAVWQANDTTLDRPVAIKILKPELSADQTFLERFRAEARHSGALSHPNIAAVYDYGETTQASGLVQAYLVMELVPGRPLSQVLTDEAPLPTDRVLALIRQVSLGLAAAHQAGIVHRDIKPGNLIITPDHKVKITDFGIARAVNAVPLTATGMVMGTARYLSPEQATGEAISPASDVYSLGVVAYEALSGEQPFDAEGQVAQAMAHVHETPKSLPGFIPPAVVALIDTMLAKYPQQRPSDGAQLVAAIDDAARGQAPTQATQVIGRAAAAPVEDATQVMPVTRATEIVPPVVAPIPPKRVTETYTADNYTAPPRPSQGRPRRRLTGPLLALILLVLFLVIGAALANQFNSTPSGPATVTETATSTPSSTTESSTTPPQTSDPSTVTTTVTQTQSPTSSAPEPSAPTSEPTSASSTAPDTTGNDGANNGGANNGGANNGGANTDPNAGAGQVDPGQAGAAEPNAVTTTDPAGGA